MRYFLAMPSSTQLPKSSVLDLRNRNYVAAPHVPDTVHFLGVDHRPAIAVESPFGAVVCEPEVRMPGINQNVPPMAALK